MPREESSVRGDNDYTALLDQDNKTFDNKPLERALQILDELDSYPTAAASTHPPAVQTTPFSSTESFAHNELRVQKKGGLVFSHFRQLGKSSEESTDDTYSERSRSTWRLGKTLGAGTHGIARELEGPTGKVTEKEMQSLRRPPLESVPKKPQPPINHFHSFKSTYDKVKKNGRRVLRVLLKGVEHIALPDSGSDKNIISHQFATDNNIKVRRGRNDKRIFELGNGTHV
jgi:hypothetical protein